MKKIKSFFVLTPFFFFIFSCSDIGDKSCPAVEPELFFVDSKSAVVKWKDLGNKYHYSASCITKAERLFVSENDTLVNEEWVTVKEVNELRDTVFSIDGLSPDTEYTVGILTHSNDAIGRPNGIGFDFRTLPE